MIAVIEGNHLVELDLARGARTTRSIAAQGLYLGPPSVRRSPAAARSRRSSRIRRAARFVVSIDPGRQETAAPRSQT